MTRSFTVANTRRIGRGFEMKIGEYHTAIINIVRPRMKFFGNNAHRAAPKFRDYLAAVSSLWFKWEKHAHFASTVQAKPIAT